MLRHIQPSFRRRRVEGAGLVELLIAMAIGLVLIAGALSVFVNSRNTYRVNQAYARMMENGRRMGMALLQRMCANAPGVAVRAMLGASTRRMC